MKPAGILSVQYTAECRYYVETENGSASATRGTRAYQFYTIGYLKSPKAMYCPVRFDPICIAGLYHDTLSGNRLEQRKQMERLVRGRCFLKCK